MHLAYVLRYKPRNCIEQNESSTKYYRSEHIYTENIMVG